MKVKFIPQNVEFEVNPDQSVMKLAHKNGVYIKSICGGLPSCAECRVRVVEGDQNVLPPSSKELTLIGTGYFIDQRRLSCQLKCFGDVTIDLTEQVAKQQVIETRRPQGSKKPETEASHAVSGNLIQQDDSLKAVAEDLSKRQSQPQQQRHGRGGGQNRGSGGGGQGRGQGGRDGGGGGRGGQGQNRNAGQGQGSGQGRNQGGGQGGQNRNRPQNQNAQPGGRDANRQQNNNRGGQGQNQPRGQANPNGGNSGSRNNNSGGGQSNPPRSGSGQGDQGSGG